jgi:hypothetical protein
VLEAANSSGAIYRPGDAEAIAAKYGFDKFLALKVGDGLLVEKHFGKNISAGFTCSGSGLSE